MQILFVYSGNKHTRISTIIRNQGISLSNYGIKVYYFPIIGKGLSGYLRSIPKLKILIKTQKFDIVHAHYSLSAFATSLAGAQSLVISFMGSDINGNCVKKIIIRVFYSIYSYGKVIVKSNDSMTKLKLKNSVIIPNGVDINHFRTIDKELTREKLSWDKSEKIILFAADPERFEKNFQLARNAFQLIANNFTKLHVLEKVPYEEMPFYFNAADVILLTSLWEGSPNVIKEAMACNRPIVSTDVGDVQLLTKNIPGCFIAKFDPADVADKIKQALEFDHSIGARQRIIDSGLEINETAKKIVRIYEDVRQNYKKDLEF